MFNLKLNRRLGGRHNEECCFNINYKTKSSQRVKRLLFEKQKLKQLV